MTVFRPYSAEKRAEPLSGFAACRCLMQTVLLLGLATIVMNGCSRQTVTMTHPGASSTGPPSTVPPSTVLPDTSITPAVPVTPVGWPQNPWKPRVAAREWKYVVIHHTASDAGSVERIHQTHLQRKDAAGNPWRGIGYHFVIGNGNGMEDGAIEPTFRWREQLEGAHAGVTRYNQQGIGICLIGNFERHPPTDAQLTSLKRLVARLSGDYDIPTKQIVGHGQLKATACPGKLFPMHELTRIGPNVSNNRTPLNTVNPRP